MQKKSIYLAGPITGKSYQDARYGWRKQFVAMLESRGAGHIQCHSPMRERDALQDEKFISADCGYPSLTGFGTSKGILTRDHNDVMNSDLVVANFLGTTSVSVGTCVEVGFAYAHRKPLIAVLEERKPELVPFTGKTLKIKGSEMALGKKHVLGILEEQGLVDVTVVDQYEDVLSRDMTFKLDGYQKTAGFVKNPHDHGFLLACASYIVRNLDDAADIAQSVLSPGL